MSVYLDSVFCPLLREQDFLQEGWRLENEEIEDKQSPFVIKGKWYLCILCFLLQKWIKDDLGELNQTVNRREKSKKK